MQIDMETGEITPFMFVVGQNGTDNSLNISINQLTNTP